MGSMRTKTASRRTAASNRFRNSLLLFAMALASCGSSIEGTVRDLKGGAINDAHILLISINPRSGAIEPLRWTRSGPSGQFSFSDMKPGLFLLDAYAAGPGFDEEAMAKSIATGVVSPAYPNGRRIVRLDRDSTKALISTHYRDITVGTSSKGGVHVTGQLNGRISEYSALYLLEPYFPTNAAGAVIARETFCNESGQFDLGYLPENVRMVRFGQLHGLDATELDLVGKSEVSLTIDLPYHTLVRFSCTTEEEDVWIKVSHADQEHGMMFGTSTSEAERLMVEGDYTVHFTAGAKEATVEFSVSPDKPTAPIAVKL